MDKITVLCGDSRVPCLSSMTGGERLTVIVGHGFGSSSKNPLPQSLAGELQKTGAGVIAFDMPGHGARPDDEELTFSGCLDSMAAVEAHIAESFPSVMIGYFGVSFSAYITLMYLALRPHAGKKAFLCSAALDMSAILERSMTQMQREQSDCSGFYLRREEGWPRPIKITRDFRRELSENNVFNAYRQGCGSELFMLHGGADTIAPPEDARRFSELTGAGLLIISGADHMLSARGSGKILLSEASCFFAEDSV